MGENKWVPIFLLILVSVVWGTTFFIVKDTVRSVDAYMLVFVRTALASIPLIVILGVRMPKEIFRKENIAGGALLGFLLATIYTSQTIGLQYTSSGHSAFITGIAVVLVPVVMFLFYRYRFTRQNVVAVLIVATGLFFLTYDTETSVNVGDLITLITATSGAFHIALIGRFVRKYNVLALVAYQFVFAAFFNIVIYLWKNPLHFNFTQEAWGALIYLAFVGTLFCYGASSWAQKFVDPVIAALIFSLEPLFASLFSYWFAGEVLNWVELSGAALILAGIIYYELPVRKLIRKLKQR